MLSSVGLCIGLPFCGRPVCPEWAVCLACQNYPLNTKRTLYCTKGKEIGEARNEMVEAALKAKAKYLWFLDDDVTPPLDAARSLIVTLENSDDSTMVAGGIYCAKVMPTEPVVCRGEGLGSFWKWKEGDIFECSSIGTGCMMIKTEVFKKLEKPWFKTVDEFCNQKNDDVYFCAKVQQSGYKILADGRVTCIHWDWDVEKQDFVPYMLPEDSYPMRPVSELEPRCERIL